MTIKRIIVCSLGILSFALNTMAARIDTLSVESPKMKKEIKVAVIVPDQALEGKKCPTLYLLHGYGGNSLTWLGIKPELPQMADRDGIIVVCPDGKNSWPIITAKVANTPKSKNSRKLPKAAATTI